MCSQHRTVSRESDPGDQLDPATSRRIVRLRMDFELVVSQKPCNSWRIICIRNTKTAISSEAGWSARFAACQRTRTSIPSPTIVRFIDRFDVVFPPKTEQDASNRLSSSNSVYSQIVGVKRVLCCRANNCAKWVSPWISSTTSRITRCLASRRTTSIPFCWLIYARNPTEDWFVWTWTTRRAVLFPSSFFFRFSRESMDTTASSEFDRAAACWSVRLLGRDSIQSPSEFEDCSSPATAATLFTSLTSTPTRRFPSTFSTIRLEVGFQPSDKRRLFHHARWLPVDSAGRRVHDYGPQRRRVAADSPHADVENPLIVRRRCTVEYQISPSVTEVFSHANPSVLVYLLLQKVELRDCRDV